MNKSMDSHASHPEAKDKHQMNLYLGPCFDLTLSAMEAVKIFDDRRKIRPGQSRAATDKALAETSVPKQPCSDN